MAPIVGCSAAMRRQQHSAAAVDAGDLPLITAQALAIAVEMGPVTEV